jgi:hypothetical protein
MCKGFQVQVETDLVEVEDQVELADVFESTVQRLH